jgi:sarcosine oxidase delta subunit
MDRLSLHRDNPKGIHYEHWLHAYGCGRRFNVARHTVTHEILAVYRMGDRKPENCENGVRARHDQGGVV